MIAKDMILKQQSLCVFRLIENSIYILDNFYPKFSIMVMERGEVKVKYELGN